MAMNELENKEKEIDLLEAVKLLWSNKKIIIKWGFISACIGIVVAFSIPKEYTSKAIMVPEMKSAQKGGGSLGQLASIASINMGGESVGITEQIYPEIVKSTPFIMEFANMQVPFDGQTISLMDYFNEEQRMSWWGHIFNFPLQCLSWVQDMFSKDVVPVSNSEINLKYLTKKQESYKDRFLKTFSISSDKKTMVISLSVSTQSPEISLMLTDSIIGELQEYMAFYKTSKTRSELESNKAMLVEARKNYYEADSLYAFAADKRRNIISYKAQVSLERLKNEKNLTYGIYQQIAAQVEYNKTKLNEETPILTVVEPASLPNNASSPRKFLILFCFVLLGGVFSSIRLLIKNNKFFIV